jgi:uncharacterized membrane protein (DUF106 family)
MTTGDIINIVATVAIVQLVCDLLANYYVFQQEPYQRLLGRLSRDQSKLKRLEAQETEAGGQLTDKQKKKLTQARKDVAECVAEVTKRHMLPNIYTAICFFLLYRIFGTEYSGKVVAILPFAPYAFIRRLTMRGIQIDADLFEPMDGIKDPNQACSILFIYMLSTISVKYYVNKAVGTRPPKGADVGVTGLIDAPQNQELLKYWGMDNETLGKVD